MLSEAFKSEFKSLGYLNPALNNSAQMNKVAVAENKR